MFYAVLLLIAIPSPFLAIAEPVAILVGLQGSRSWLLTGLALAAGQTIAFIMLYFFGERVLRRIPKLKRQLDRFDMDRFADKAAYLLVIGSFVGLPPHNAMSALSPLVGFRFVPFLTITFIGRALRFCLLAGTPFVFAEIFGTEWLPSWVNECLE